LTLPERACVQAWVRTKRSMRCIKPISSAKGTNAIGGSRPLRGVLPSHESLEAHDGPEAKVEDRLIVQTHLVLEDRATQVGLEFEAFNDRDVHLVLELLVAVLAFALGPVHREVGVAQQLIARVVANTERDADAHRGRELLGSDRDRFAQGAHDSLGESNDLAATGDVLDEHGELVTAQSSCGVGPAKNGDEVGRDRLQQFVARGVAEAVIDRS
jgi:hypothetical protein